MAQHGFSARHARHVSNVAIYVNGIVAVFMFISIGAVAFGLIPR